MTVLITSSPFIDGAPKAILSNRNQFVDRIREVLPPFPQVVFVASDPQDHAGTCTFASITCAAFAEAGIHFGSYQVLDATSAHRAYSMLSHSDFVVLCGGHVPTQNAFFRKLRLRHILKNYSGTVMGISAGSMNLAETVYVQPEEPGESAPDFVRFAPGLALTGVNILPHYQKVKDNLLDGLRLFEDITYADSMGHEFFALPDNSYFYQDEESLLLFGEAYRLQDGVLEKICETDECLDMAAFE